MTKAKTNSAGGVEADKLRASLQDARAEIVELKGELSKKDKALKASRAQLEDLQNNINGR